MKKYFVIAMAVLLFASFTSSEISDKSFAKAEQVEGYYIFIMSKPVKEYEYLGTVKVGVTWSGKPEENFNSILKRVKKDYPKADAIIFNDIDMKKVDAIQFK